MVAVDEAAAVADRGLAQGVYFDKFLQFVAEHRSLASDNLTLVQRPALGRTFTAGSISATASRR